MCKWGTTVSMPLTVPAYLSHTGEAYTKEVGVDACIAPIVAALNAAGIATTQSCCGHGKGPGSIMLADGRNLIIGPDDGDHVERRVRAAERLCSIYWDIAVAAVGEDEVRRRRDEEIARIIGTGARA